MGGIGPPLRRRAGHFDLVGLQAQCALNYAHLLRLLPQIRKAGSTRQIALRHAQQDFGVLYFRVLEVCPWTSTVQLRHGGACNWLQMPPLLIRAYHDVRLAEVIAAARERHLHCRYPYPNAAMHQPDEKNQVNRFLGQWLKHCLALGHATLPV